MKNIIAGLCLLSFAVALNCPAIERSELSPEAAALVPATDITIVVLKDGTKVEGIKTAETPEKVTLKVKKSASISMAKEIEKVNIKSINKADAGSMLASRLLTYKVDSTNSLPEQTYKKVLALFDEFLAKCATLPEATEIKKIREDFGDELKRVQRGMTKIDGEWLTPVCAAVKRFNLATEQIATLQARPDFNTNQKVKDFYAGLLEKRRVAAKSLPKMIQDHLPRLIENREFDEAISEVKAFLDFWVQQVIKSEGRAEEVMQGMDFDYLLRMQKNIMAAYTASRPVAEKPARMPADKNMIYIPGGYFLMGGDVTDPKNDAFPAHIVYVSPFVIDKYEVTNEEYRKFVDHVKKTGDSSMEHPAAGLLKKHDAEGWNTPNLAGDKQPVAGVDCFDAYAYAKWVGKRLPTEAEWEKAARGVDLRVFPWCGTNSAAICAANYAGGRDLFVKEIDRQIPKVAPEPPARVGLFGKKEPPPPPPPTVIPAKPWDVDKLMPDLAIRETEAGKFDWNQRETPYTNDVSAYGLYHMGGNVSEWVSDVYSNGYYGVSPLRDPAGPRDGVMHVYRGGSYLSTSPSELSSCLRGFTVDKPKSGCTADGRAFVGFRCAKSLDVVAQPAVPPAQKPSAVSPATLKK